MSRTRLYWIPRLSGKCVGEITRNDVEAFFSSDEAQKLAPKTVNSIIETITIPMKWAYYHDLIQNNCFDGIIKCSNQSKERKIIDMETANRLMELDWDNEEAKIANELAMHTGMRAGEIQALTIDDLGDDEIYVRKSWSKYDGLKCCKNGEERSVPIPISQQLYLKLKMLADFNPLIMDSFSTAQYLKNQWTVNSLINTSNAHLKTLVMKTREKSVSIPGATSSVHECWIM